MKCNNCGNTLPDNATFCDSCGSVVEPEAKPAKKKENVMAGIVGALIGAVIGGASIVLVSRLGFVASICGVILAVCTLKGYELLGGSLSKVGVVICGVLMLVTPYIADRLDWALLLMEDFEATFNESLSLSTAFSLIPDLISEGFIEIEMGEYIKNLGMIYLFTVIGGIGSVINALKK